MMDILNRIDAAIERITSGRAAMRVPAEETDPDLVLSECRKLLAASRDDVVSAPAEEMWALISEGVFGLTAHKATFDAAEAKQWRDAGCTVRAYCDPAAQQSATVSASEIFKQEFSWPCLPTFPQSSAHIAGYQYFTEHQMQGYANAYGEEVRKAMVAARSRHDVDLPADEVSEFETMLEHFDDSEDTSVDYGRLLEWAERGLLHCGHFTVTQKGRDALDAARSMGKGEAS